MFQYIESTEQPVYEIHTYAFNIVLREIQYNTEGGKAGSLK